MGKKLGVTVRQEGVHGTGAQGFREIGRDVEGLMNCNPENSFDGVVRKNYRGVGR